MVTSQAIHNFTYVLKVHVVAVNVMSYKPANNNNSVFVMHLDILGNT